MMSQSHSKEDALSMHRPTSLPIAIFRSHLPVVSLFQSRVEGAFPRKIQGILLRVQNREEGNKDLDSVEDQETRYKFKV